MELKTAISSRASVRQYSAAPVREEDLRQMVRMAGLAPSVNNMQPWKFVAITNRDLLHNMGVAVHAKLQEMFSHNPDQQAAIVTEVGWFSTFFAKAPAVIAVCKQPYEAVIDEALQTINLTHDQLNLLRGMPDIQSIGAAVQNLLLTATDLGYGSCWLSGPLIARDHLQALLNIQAPWLLAAMVAIGRPGGDAIQKPKKDLNEIFELRE